jgi:hypothetical protein
MTESDTKPRDTNPPADAADSSNHAAAPIFADESQNKTVEAGNDGSNHPKHWTDYTTLVVAGIALVISGVSAWIALLQKDSMNGQLQVMKDQLAEMKAEQRPQIIAKVLGPQKFNGTSWLYWANIKNSGHLPTVGLEIVIIDPQIAFFSLMERSSSGGMPTAKASAIAHAINAPPDPIEYFDPKITDPRPFISKNVIGPGDELNLNPPGWTLDERELPQMGQRDELMPFYFGAIRYFDSSSRKTQHITKFCSNVVAGISAGTPEGTTPLIVPCSHWNCTDDDCERDKKEYEADVVKTTQTLPQR